MIDLSVLLSALAALIVSLSGLTPCKKYEGILTSPAPSARHGLIGSIKAPDSFVAPASRSSGGSVEMPKAVSIDQASWSSDFVVGRLN